MILKEDIDNTLNKMILSASGWRGVFAAGCAAGDEESKTEKISEAHKIICGAAAFVFAEYLMSAECGTRKDEGKPVVLLGNDTRPTGKEIIQAMVPILLSLGCEVKYAGIAAAPEIMAWAGTWNKNRAGFIYVSASHNPVGHNGLKFGLTDGGVLAANEADKLIVSFRGFLNNDDNLKKIYSLISAADSNHQFADELEPCGSWLKNIENSKNECYKAYYGFCSEVVYGNQKSGSPFVVDALKKGLAESPLGIVCDFNGSARTVSIDREFLSSLGLKFECINDKPGQIAHRIVPEGESLEPCVSLLDEMHKRDASYMLGYVPDCDGDRGNLVIWDDAINKTRALDACASNARALDACASKARALDAQEVFALACVAELSHLVWSREFIPGSASLKAAVAVNDPTSMRIDRIAACFGVSVFRAEVGEANVVSLARKLRKEGYIVRILGEGSAGGNITHPSAVRDPINTVLAIVKMLSVRFSDNAEFSADSKRGFFKIWCELSGQKYRDDFSLADIIASLPPFITTPAYDKNAVMRIKTEDHAILKDRYQEVFLREWEEQKEFIKTHFGFYNWEAIAYNGTEERRKLSRFGEAGRGGLKIIFFDSEDRETAFIWMRGSATEPVFRIMADVAGSDADAEQWLLNWQRGMIMKSDGND